jgi:hypothetical protein
LIDFAPGSGFRHPLPLGNPDLKATRAITALPSIKQAHCGAVLLSACLGLTGPSMFWLRHTETALPSGVLERRERHCIGGQDVPAIAWSAGALRCPILGMPPIGRPAIHPYLAAVPESLLALRHPIVTGGTA